MPTVSYIIKLIIIISHLNLERPSRIRLKRCRHTVIEADKINIYSTLMLYISAAER